MDSSLVILAFIGIWLMVLTVLVLRMIAHYNKLTKGSSEKTMQAVLTTLFQQQKANAKDIATLQEAVRYVEADGKLHLQRIGVVRFNPFSDTGGSQSFTLAMLDGKENGIIMTSLYARTGNRWYIKHIKAGVCEDVALSKEEESAIKKARPI